LSGHLADEALKLGAVPMGGTMELTAEQGSELAKPLDRKYVKQRPGPGGKQLSYIEGYTAIRIANEVFGYDGWSYEVQSIREVEKGVIAHIRLRVGATVREDVGFGDGNAELAYKEAITDALKRALRTFGDRFGLDLYDKDSELHKPERKAAAPEAPAAGRCPIHNLPMFKSTKTNRVGHVHDGVPCFGVVEEAQAALA
jgi:DNA recombination protein Rad52